MARADTRSLATPAAQTESGRLHSAEDAESGLPLQFRRALQHLTDEEYRHLAALAQTRTFEAGAVIAEAGPGRHSLCLLTGGSACMMRNEAGQDVAIAHFLPNTLVGGFSYIEHNPADARICAFEKAEVRIIDEQVLHLLLTSDPGLRERFYQSLGDYVCPPGAAHADEMRTRWFAYRQPRLS